MKAVLQRVKQAQLTVDTTVVSTISHGLVVLVSVGKDDSSDDASWLAEKILGLRIFSSAGKMNQNIVDVGGDLLLVSQFTLHANTKKGKRPSFEKSAPREQALNLFNECINQLKKNYSGIIKIGVFGADMTIAITLRGPVTIMLDSKNT